MAGSPELKNTAETTETVPRRKFLVLNVFKDIESKPEGATFKEAALNWLKNRMSAAEFKRLQLNYNGKPKLTDLFKEIEIFMYTFDNEKLVKEARRRKLSESEFTRNTTSAILKGLSADIRLKTPDVKLLMERLIKANREDPYPTLYIKDIVDPKLEITKEVLLVMKAKLPELQLAQMLGSISQTQFDSFKKLIADAEVKLKTQDPFIKHLKKIEDDPALKNALKKINEVLYKWMQGQVGGDEFKRIKFRQVWTLEEGQPILLKKMFQDALLIMYTRNNGRYLKLFTTAKGAQLQEGYNKCLSDFGRELMNIAPQEKKVLEDIIKAAGLNVQR